MDVTTVTQRDWIILNNDLSLLSIILIHILLFKNISFFSSFILDTFSDEVFFLNYHLFYRRFSFRMILFVFN